MKTKIFSYKNFIGAETDLDKGKFLNNPKAEGQLGCVVPVEEILITKEAKNLLLKAKREGGSFASMMITKHEKEGGSIGLLGHWKHAYCLDDAVLSRDCDLSLLNDLEEVNIDIPEDFMEYVDSKQ